MNRMLTAALLLALSATAYAKEGGKDTFAVCRADVDRLCKNVQPGEGRQVQCIVSNRANLSGDCATRSPGSWRRNSRCRARSRR